MTEGQTTGETESLGMGRDFFRSIHRIDNASSFSARSRLSRLTRFAPLPQRPAIALLHACMPTVQNLLLRLTELTKKTSFSEMAPLFAAVISRYEHAFAASAAVASADSPESTPLACVGTHRI